MLKLLIRARPALLLTSLFLFAIAGPSFGADATQSPGWRDVALVALSLVLSLISAWATFMQRTILKLQQDLTKTREQMLAEYHNAEQVKDAVKAGVQEAINPVSIRIAVISERLGIRPGEG